MRFLRRRDAHRQPVVDVALVVGDLHALAGVTVLDAHRGFVQAAAQHGQVVQGDRSLRREDGLEGVGASGGVARHAQEADHQAITFRPIAYLAAAAGIEVVPEHGHQVAGRTAAGQRVVAALGTAGLTEAQPAVAADVELAEGLAVEGEGEADGQGARPLVIAQGHRRAAAADVRPVKGWAAGSVAIAPGIAGLARLRRGQRAAPLDAPLRRVVRRSTGDAALHKIHLRRQRVEQRDGGRRRRAAVAQRHAVGQQPAGSDVDRLHRLLAELQVRRVHLGDSGSLDGQPVGQLQPGAVLDDCPARQPLANGGGEGEGDHAAGRQRTLPGDGLGRRIIRRAAAGAAFDVGHGRGQRVHQRRLAGDAQGVAQRQRDAQRAARRDGCRCHLLLQRRRAQPGQRLRQRPRPRLSRPAPLQSKGQVDQPIAAVFNPQRRHPAGQIVHGDGHGAGVGGSHEIGGIQELVGVGGGEVQLHPLQDASGQAVHASAESIVLHVAGVQQVAVVARAAVPIADVLPHQQQPTAAQQEATQRIHHRRVAPLSVNVARRAPGVDPDDHVVGGQFRARGYRGQVGDAPHVVEITRRIEGVPVVQRDVILQPGIGIEQQQAGSRRQPEVLRGHLAGDDAHRGPRQAVTRAAGRQRVASRRQSQAVKPAVVRDRLGRRALGPYRHRAQQPTAHLQGTATDGAGGQRLQPEVAQRAVALHHLYLLVRLRRVAESDRRHPVAAGGHGHSVGTVRVAGRAERMAGVLADAFHRRAGQRQPRVGGDHLPGQPARAQSPGNGSVGVEPARAVAVVRPRLAQVVGRAGHEGFQIVHGQCGVCCQEQRRRARGVRRGHGGAVRGLVPAIGDAGEHRHARRGDVRLDLVPVGGAAAGEVAQHLVGVYRRHAEAVGVAAGRAHRAGAQGSLVAAGEHGQDGRRPQRGHVVPEGGVGDVAGAPGAIEDVGGLRRVRVFAVEIGGGQNPLKTLVQRGVGGAAAVIEDLDRHPERPRCDADVLHGGLRIVADQGAHGVGTVTQAIIGGSRIRAGEVVPVVGV